MLNSNTNGKKTAATGTGAVVGGVAGGVAGGAAAGAAIGGMTGPVGAAVGAAAGAVVGALSGRAVARSVDPAKEDLYWRDNHAAQPYSADGSFDDYRPAYGYGVDAYSRYPGKTFDEVEPELGRGWSARRGNSPLEWDNAKHASRGAWHRLSNTVEDVIPGDSDRDGH